VGEWTCAKRLCNFCFCEMRLNLISAFLVLRQHHCPSPSVYVKVYWMTSPAHLRVLNFTRWYIFLGRCPSSIFCTRGTPPSLPTELDPANPAQAGLGLGKQPRVKSLRSFCTRMCPQNPVQDDRSDFTRGCIPRLGGLATCCAGSAPGAGAYAWYPPCWGACAYSGCCA